MPARARAARARRPKVAGALAPFAARLVAWQRAHGRHDLPWQRTRDAYRVWLSEVMLQQTQVATALPYYARFLARFPSVGALAAAPLDDVLAHWSGLGYYRRAHHLHAAAKAVVAQHGGEFPRDVERLAALPGIGRSTAAAIATFAFGARAAILDGNVKRVLARHRGIGGFPGAPKVERELWSAAEALLPDADVEAYAQGLMDLGATICARSAPRCLLCPVAQDCVARREGRTAELPGPRPARDVPQRAVQLIVCEHDGRLLVERRPDSGVWSGLWSLPEAPVDADGRRAAVQRTGSAVKAAAALPPLTHAFTHFTLTMHPRRFVVAGAPADPKDRERWVTHGEARALGLPAPIRRLIAALAAAPAGARAAVSERPAGRAEPSRPTRAAGPAGAVPRPGRRRGTR